jgi:hypothetical protein
MMNPTDKLLEIIAEQCIILDEILIAQKRIRDVVHAKDWPALEAAIAGFYALSKEFNAKESERQTVRNEHPASYESAEVRDGLLFVRRKLAVSRIENAALNEYLKITQNFLRGIFNSVAESRAGKVYSRKGAMVQSRPERLVLDTLL